ncbi:MAG: ribbon-helix-helix domain-containing protein [Alphaproteobacteria bacterium]|nr:ribbon-helix-helix domain-containing protein [Alphaproteobacteria bacterium]
MPSQAEVKRSLAIAGHRTSVSLEAPFWAELKEIAQGEHRSVASLVAEIDAGRAPGRASLSSAIRCFVLMRLKAKLGDLNAR